MKNCMYYLLGHFNLLTMVGDDLGMKNLIFKSTNKRHINMF